MVTVLAHMTAPVVARSVVDQPLLVGAAGVVVVLAILLVFVMVLRSGNHREVGIGLDGRQEPYGQPRARPSQPNPYGPSAYGYSPQSPYDSRDAAYRGWQPDDRGMAGGQPSNAGWDAGYANAPMGGSPQAAWGPSSGGTRRDEPGWGPNQQGTGWQNQAGWDTASANQGQSPWGQAAAPAASAAPWSAPTENNNWGSQLGPNAQPYAQGGGQSQPFGQGFAFGQEQSFSSQGASASSYSGTPGAGYGPSYEAPGQAAMGANGWSAPALNSAPGLAGAQGALARGGSSDDRSAFVFGGDMARPGRSGGGPGASTVGASLVVRQGKEPGRVYEVRNDRTTIGRGRESDIFLEDLAVSRNHTSIVRDDQGNYILRDEGSANGTLVNNQPVTTPVVLQVGDTVQVGQTIMTFSRR